MLVESDAAYSSLDEVTVAGRVGRPVSEGDSGSNSHCRLPLTPMVGNWLAWDVESGESDNAYSSLIKPAAQRDSITPSKFVCSRQAGFAVGSAAAVGMLYRGLQVEGLKAR